jgi:hypothetical protein
MDEARRIAANGQSLAYVYARATEAEAAQAKVLMKTKRGG